MQRWEYKVISMRDGAYTQTLNELGREGWELVSVASDVHQTPAPGRRASLPMPGALGKIEGAAAKLSGSAGDKEVSPQDGAIVTTQLWVLRRPLEDD